MRIIALCAVLLAALSTAAQPARGPDGPYNPDAEHRFGRPNPQAPPELEQFAFMIGEFDCAERLRQPDGSWSEFDASWHGYYFLNGMGIVDRYWNGRVATANTRVFDAQRGRWVVTYFQMPGASSGTWEGGREGEAMIMRQPRPQPDGTTAESRLTFYDIHADGYEWKAESVAGEVATANWTSSCRRRGAESADP